MPSFHIGTHFAGPGPAASQEDAAVATLARAPMASACAHPTFAHAIIVVEEIDPVHFDYDEGHRDGAARERPSIGHRPDGVTLTHRSRDPVRAEAP